MGSEAALTGELCGKRSSALAASHVQDGRVAVSPPESGALEYRLGVEPGHVLSDEHLRFRRRVAVRSLLGCHVGLGKCIIPFFKAFGTAICQGIYISADLLQFKLSRYGIDFEFCEEICE